MKKIILLLVLILVGCEDKPITKTYNDPYNKEAAVEYAKKYVYERNDEYASLESNCTNFVSQVLVAGGKQMDEVSKPVENQRITYNKDSSSWYSTYMWSYHNRWKEFNVSTSFVRTNDFFNYWTEVRNMDYHECINSIGGLVNIYEFCDIGDIIVLYNQDDDIEHLCIITKMEEDNIFISANTIDFLDRSIVEISSQNYPRIGLINIE